MVMDEVIILTNMDEIKHINCFDTYHVDFHSKTNHVLIDCTYIKIAFTTTQQLIKLDQKTNNKTKHFM